MALKGYDTAGLCARARAWLSHKNSKGRGEMLDHQCSEAETMLHQMSEHQMSLIFSSVSGGYKNNTMTHGR